MRLAIPPICVPHYKQPDPSSGSHAIIQGVHCSATTVLQKITQQNESRINSSEFTRVGDSELTVIANPSDSCNAKDVTKVKSSSRAKSA